VRVRKIDNDHVRFSVIEDREVAGLGEMSYLVFVNRFTRVESVEDACVRIKLLGYVASRRVRIYGEEFELLSDPFPEHGRMAIRARAKGRSDIRVLPLPAIIVQSDRGKKVKAA
jgi:hypothetical protein